MKSVGQASYLFPYGLDEYKFPRGPKTEAPSNSWKKSINVTGPYDAPRVAFDLSRELYVWFGQSEDAIPYTKRVSDHSVIDIETIAAIK